MMTAIITTMATAVEVVHCQLFPEILMIAHPARIGDLMTSCRPIATAICTWVMSFVARVIRLAVENLLISLDGERLHLAELHGAKALGKGCGDVGGDVTDHQRREEASERESEHHPSFVHDLVDRAAGLDQVGDREHVVRDLQVQPHPATMNAVHTAISPHSLVFRYFRIIFHQRYS